MPDLLIELFCEEIPARMQRRAAEDLKKLVTDALVERGCLYEGARAFATPRRLALHVVGLPANQPDVREEKKGPRVGAPEGAIQGFLKSAGLTDIAQATIQSDPKKGEFYVAIVEKPGRPVPDVIAEIVPGIVKSFPWPKSMRWGASSASPARCAGCARCNPSSARSAPRPRRRKWSRSRSTASAPRDVTRGHRFMAGDLILVRRFDDYEAALQKAIVVLDADRRKEIILADARNLAFARGLELVEDEALLEEVAGLVEWPVVLVGSFDPELPRHPARGRARHHPRQPEVLRAARSRHGRAQQPLRPRRQYRGERRRGQDRRRQRARRARAPLRRPPFLGHRPARPARLRHAENAGKPLDQRLAKLKKLGIVFHEKLGTQGERVERIVALARELAPLVGADPELAARAAELCKADLVTEMVGEFPEVQGLMGRRYAELQGEHPSVAAAIEEHYKPQGPSDRVPTDPVSRGRRAGRQAGHAGRLLGHRREADGQQGPLRAAPGGVGRGAAGVGEWTRALSAARLFEHGT